MLEPAIYGHILKSTAVIIKRLYVLPVRKRFLKEEAFNCSIGIGFDIGVFSQIISVPASVVKIWYRCITNMHIEAIKKVQAQVMNKHFQFSNSIMLLLQVLPLSY